MAKATISALVDGGKASAGAPLGPALGPLGLNIGKVIAEINEKTKEFSGIKVPVQIIVDKATKNFEVKIGSPPVSSLLKKKFGLEKGSTEPGKTIVKDVPLKEIIEIARMKKDSLFSKTLKAATKEVLGSCVAIGISVDGKSPKEVQVLIDEGQYDSEFGD